MQVRITLTGTSPLLCHNAQLSDPDHEIVRQIKALTSKRTKTEDDRRAIEKLEWYGGLYTDPDIPGPVMPTSNIRKCLIESGKITKQGKGVGRSLAFREMAVPLTYDGPRNIDQLFADLSYHNRASVKIGTSRTMRVRPQFPRWAITAEALLLEDVMDPENLARIVEYAGLAEGLGDNRTNGYGRFEGRVEQI